MPRRRKTDAEVEKAKSSVAEVLKGRSLLGPLQPTKKKPKKRARGISAVAASRLLAEINEKIEREDLTELSPRHWVALFCWMHEAVYDIPCVEEVRPEWNVASARVSEMLTVEFDGDEEEFLEYVQWLAKREEETEIWRRSNRRPGKRLRWRDFYMLKSKLTDYRLNKARQEGPE